MVKNFFRAIKDLFVSMGEERIKKHDEFIEKFKEAKTDEEKRAIVAQNTFSNGN